MMLEACIQGVGIALLPVFSALPYLKTGQLIQLLPDYKTYLEISISIVFPENRYVSTRVRLLIDWLVQLSQSFDW